MGDSCWILLVLPMSRAHKVSYHIGCLSLVHQNLVTPRHVMPGSRFAKPRQDGPTVLHVQGLAFVSRLF
jgi:hypothetical protein